MKSSNIYETKIKPSTPLEIAVSGKPSVKGEKIEPRLPQRIGFMRGEGSVPDDFDVMGAGEIADMFERRDL